MITLVEGIRNAFRTAHKLLSAFAGAVLGLAILIGSLWRLWLSLAAIKYLLGW